MENACKVLQMILRPLCASIGLVEVDGGGRVGAGPAALVAGIDPQSSGLRPAAARIEHRKRRVVGIQAIRGEDVAAQPVMQGIQPPAGTTHPSRQGRPRDLDTLAGKDLRLPVQGKMIAIFADQDMREQGRRRMPAGDDSRGCRLPAPPSRTAGTHIWGGGCGSRAGWPAHSPASPRRSRRSGAGLRRNARSHCPPHRAAAPRGADDRAVACAAPVRPAAVPAGVRSSPRASASRSSSASAIWSGSRRSDFRPNRARCSCLMICCRRAISLSRCSTRPVMSRTSWCRSAVSSGRLSRSSRMVDYTSETAKNQAFPMY